MRSMFTFITLLELARKNTSKEFFLKLTSSKIADTKVSGF